MVAESTKKSAGEEEADTSNAESLTPAQLKRLWKATPEGAKVARVLKIFWIPLILGGVYLQATVWWNLSDTPWLRVLFQILGVVLWFVGCALAVALFDIIYADSKFNNFQVQLESSRLLAAYNEELDSSLDLKDLWVLNQRRLDLYHRIATNQSRSSFRNAQLAASIGFLLLIASAALVWYSDSVAAAITTGSIGAFGGALGAYLGRTFIKSQEGAAAQLRQYFDHPVELSKILVVERLVERLSPEDRVSVIQMMAQSILGVDVLRDSPASGDEDGRS
ncbi:hypothetical protein JMF97_30400 [Micromonospora fiedleri]|uniref:Cyanobacterial TRADD-N associated 2 transmembrane domain-containing protein n=1 Tax=Micromonospora fiedleri TaxID=1157498 RepID=A0ABS1UVR4_9ACTN|nr:hypothetical protein [Micromonospora fiedleri]MBL6280472.1 hypothetical protein [Micromonospora fiedleri]